MDLISILNEEQIAFLGNLGYNIVAVENGYTLEQVGIIIDKLNSMIDRKYMVKMCEDIITVITMDPS